MLSGVSAPWRASAAAALAAFESAEVQRVEPRRSVPDVTRASLAPIFSTQPRAAEITRARVFEEPLLPLGDTTENENAALADAVLAYLAARTPDNVEPFDRFFGRFPESAWRPSLLVNVGLVYRRTGYFSRALHYWQLAWEQTRELVDDAGRAVADRALGELFELNARLGRLEELTALFAEIDGRDVRGAATEKISGARQSRWVMENRPEHAFRCGPFALEQLLKHARPSEDIPQDVRRFPSTQRGTSLLQLRDLSSKVGIAAMPAHRRPGAEIIVPSVVHWRVGHFAALVKVEGGKVLMRDPTFGDEMWLSPAAIDAEASGFFLVNAQVLPVGWARVEDDSAADIWGKGLSAATDSSEGPGDGPECPTNCGGPGGGPGGPPPGPPMAVPSIQMMLVSIILRDTPVGYAPPVGPSVRFTATYHQREAFQPQAFYYSNLGRKWTFDWLSYIEDDPANGSAAVHLYLRGAGRETASGYNGQTQEYGQTVRTQSIIKRTSASPIEYERRLPDGSLEVFGQPDGASTFPRRVFLTRIEDPQGQALTMTYDSSLRLVAVTDAIGQVTTLSYEHSDPLKITEVEDPFGRTATFEYDSSGRLARITDILGIQSSFTYGSNDIVSTLTTPYGETRFTTGEHGLVRWAEMIDPTGGRERVQYGAGLVYSEPTNVLPTGMLIDNAAINHHNTLYWDRVAMAKAPGDPAAATDYHWALVSSGLYQSSAVPLSIKKPLENRVWFNYHGGTAQNEGTVRKVVAEGRVLDDGTTQLTKREVNARGNVTKTIDALGRTTEYVYAANNIDLIEIRQTTGGINEKLFVATYNGQHLPLTTTDASGQTTTFTYNSRGQVLTITNPKSEVTTNTYDTNGYLVSVARPLGGQTTFIYDSQGRVATVSETDGETLDFTYDAADRPVRTTHEDSSYEENTYSRLDVASRRDRLGRITRYAFDGAQRLVATTDPAGRTITQEWCACGALDALVDPNGNRTSWVRDVQGRVTKEVRANGSETVYVYEATTSRLKTMTDPKLQVTTYAYDKVGALTGLTYTNEEHATPDVSFTYEAAYGRLASMVDGTGTTTYAYHPTTATPQLGAGQLFEVDGPLSNDVIAYAYDELGRVTNRTINGSANSVTWAFDALGRVTSEVNVLGTFGYTYDATSPRLATVSYPNSQTSAYSYFGATADHRLQTIHHKYPNGSTLSKFDYTYDTVGNILTWRQQADADAVMWEYGYDAADQLTTAVKKSTDPTPVLLQRFAYTYDPAGNRTAEQIDDAITTSVYNDMNQLVSQTPGGMLRFEGTLDEPAAVMIGGVPATVSADNRFVGQAQVGTGTSQVEIRAIDPNGNIRINTYEVSQAGSARSFAYDANGNMTGDGMRTFDWDAKNQLVEFAHGVDVTQFDYDANGRRVRFRRLSDSQVSYESVLIMCDFELCETRSPAGVVLGAFYGLGRLDGTNAVFTMADHLGSTRHTTSQAGTRISSVEFDPFGRVAGSNGPPIEPGAFARLNKLGEIDFGVFREYDADTGRWLKQDPIGLDGGLNLYGYVENNPLTAVDPLGLACSELARMPIGFWRQVSVSRTFGPKQFSGASTSGPEKGPRLGVPFTVVYCRWVRSAFEETVSQRPVLVMELCDTECGATIRYRQTTERRRRSRSYEDRGGFSFILPPWVSPALATAECQRRIS